MPTYADKNQENQSRFALDHATAVKVGNEQNQVSTFQFVDNRPEAVRNRKLQELANNSPRIQQLKAMQEMANNSPRVRQLKALQETANNRSQVKQTFQLQEKINSQTGKSAYRREVEDKEVVQAKFAHEKQIEEDVFLAITSPSAEDASTFYGHDEVAYPDLGFTTMIRNHDGPDIDYGIEEGEDNAKTATPTRSDTSDEGTNDSWSLEEGTHQIPGEQVSEKDLYVILSGEIAASALAAEEEHVSDYRYAKEQILDKADDWLNDNLGDETFGPRESEEELWELVDDHINTQLKTHLGLTGVGNFEWANVHTYYKQAADQTDKRDANDWHTFGNEDDEQADRVNRTITAGDSEVGSHDSSDVIDLTEVE